MSKESQAGRLSVCGIILSAAWVFGSGIAPADWPNYGRDPQGTRYAPLNQINLANVSKLQVAWVYHTGDNQRRSTIECTPVVVDGVMYLTSPALRVIALNAATGAELWKYEPGPPLHRMNHVLANWDKGGRGVNRGVAYWSDGQARGGRRIFFGTSDGRLISLDSTDGKPDPHFGDRGVVDLRADVGRDLDGLTYGSTSPPAVWQDLVILGFEDGEGPGPTAPGDIRAFDARTGKERWRFHTVPRKGEYGYDSWTEGSTADRGGANDWGGFSLDDRGILYAALGSAAFDFYGGDRQGDDLFANSVVAIDARTGKRLWHFQTIRHDLWDYDLPAYPNLVTVHRDGVSRKAVAQVSKAGYVYVLDRATGKSLFPLEERPTPVSDVRGEQPAPFQIAPLKPPPLARQGFTEADVTDLSPAVHDEVLARLKGLRHGPMYTPPSVRGTVVLPGFHGGANWSGAAVDPNQGILYVNTNNIPFTVELGPAPAGIPDPYTNKGYPHFNDRNGYPAVKPPWGLLNAVDLNRGEIIWQTPLGEYPELTARGIPPTGTENFGGCILTAGGLLFIGSSKDEKFRAFDQNTGKVVWEFKLDAGGYATPATYEAQGRQFVVIAAGGAGKQKTKPGDAFYAFALPSPEKPKKGVRP